MADSDGGVIDLQRLRRSCSECSLRTLCLPAGISGDDLAQLDRVVRSRMPLDAGDALFHAGDAFEHIFVVRGGCLRTAQPADDGAEQLIGFHLPGELVGLEAISDGRHYLDAVALERTSVCAVPFTQLEQVASSVPGLQHQLLRIISREMAHEQRHLVALGRRVAEQRLAIFLFSLSQRLQAAGYPGEAFHLSMSREDIANYLGLALETVSRLFGRMAEDGVIAVERRDIRILDRVRLSELAGQPDCGPDPQGGEASSGPL